MPSDAGTAGRLHNDAVRAEFTRQAEAYAAAPAITNAGRLARLVRAIDPAPSARALDVATGPGHLAMALAARCREVVSVDLTAAPVAIAQRLSRERGITNISFQIGEADPLPFADDEFDLVVCRFAFHHFLNPAAILAQMCRVCRADGTLAVEDLFVSEAPGRADYANRVERLRDTSHTAALSLSSLAAAIGRAGLEIESFYSDRLHSNLEDWLASSQTPAEPAAAVRSLIAADMREDLSGMRPFVRDGAIHFVQRTAAFICRKR